MEAPKDSSTFSVIHLVLGGVLTTPCLAVLKAVVPLPWIAVFTPWLGCLLLFGIALGRNVLRPSCRSQRSRRTPKS